MRPTRTFENGTTSADALREAASAVSRSTPLTLVSAAVAGDDLQSIATAAGEALGRPVAIALPGLNALIAFPPTAVAGGTGQNLLAYATTVIAEHALPETGPVAQAVMIRIGREVVGVVAALGDDPADPDARAWLEAAAAAATVTALIRETQESDTEGSRRALLQTLSLGPPSDPAALIGQGQRLGFDLSAGAIAICAAWPAADKLAHELPTVPSVLLAKVQDAHVLGLLPLAAAPSGAPELEPVLTALESAGLRAAVSDPHPDPMTLHNALREAEVLLALEMEGDMMLASEEDTYRLLIRVLLRDPGELELLRARTISALARYDSEHDTELLATLRAFLGHHGSTTETAEAMQLHRHTVGYRLTRVQEVSGLSPYESDGRERLSLGLKAHRIIEADARRPRR